MASPPKSGSKKSGRRPAASDHTARRRADTFEVAVRFLSQGDRSADRVHQYLLTKGHSERSTKLTLQRLKRVGYLDDGATAFRVAERRLLRRSMAKAALVEALIEQGFGGGTAAEAAERAYGGVPEQSVATRFLRALPVRWKDARREARRRAGLLRARGFSDEVIDSVLTFPDMEF